jgi:hypothetical protein
MTQRKNVLLYINVVSDHNGLSGFGRKRKIGVDQLKSQFHVFSRNVVLRGFNENIAGLLFDGNEFPPVLMLFFL